MANLEHSGPLSPRNYVRVIALAPNLWAASFHDTREFFDYSSTIKLLSLSDFYKRVSFDLKTLTTKLEIVISFVAAVNRKFMFGRQVGQYPRIETPRSPRISAQTEGSQQSGVPTIHMYGILIMTLKCSSLFAFRFSTWEWPAHEALVLGHEV